LPPDAISPRARGGRQDRRRDGLLDVLRQADFVALTRPLTPKTENLIDAKALAAMKRSICGETSEPGPLI